MKATDLEFNLVLAFLLLFYYSYFCHCQFVGEFEWLDHTGICLLLVLPFQGYSHAELKWLHPLEVGLSKYFQDSTNHSLYLLFSCKKNTTVLFWRNRNFARAIVPLPIVFVLAIFTIPKTAFSTIRSTFRNFHTHLMISRVIG